VLADVRRGYGGKRVIAVEMIVAMFVVFYHGRDRIGSLTIVFNDQSDSNKRSDLGQT
jgi:hypothetical protein